MILEDISPCEGKSCDRMLELLLYGLLPSFALGWLLARELFNCFIVFQYSHPFEKQKRKKENKLIPLDWYFPFNLFRVSNLSQQRT